MTDFRPWTKTELAYAINEYNKGTTAKDIGMVLGRSKRAVGARISHARLNGHDVLREPRKISTPNAITVRASDMGMNAKFKRLSNKDRELSIADLMRGRMFTSHKVLEDRQPDFAHGARVSQMIREML